MTSPRPEAVGSPVTDNAVDELYKRGYAVAEGPDETRLFQLIAAKHAILLESKGMRHSRLGQNGLKRAWAKHYGLSARTKHLEVIARLQVDIEALHTKLHQLKLPFEGTKS